MRKIIVLEDELFNPGLIGIVNGEQDYGHRMFDLGQNLRVRQAVQGDRTALTKLLQRKSFVHRHLGWHPPLSWLGKQPFYVLEGEQGILSSLVCPPDEDGIIWLRLFATAPGFPVQQAWKMLWPPALDWLQEHNDGLFINSLVLTNEMKNLLNRSGFYEAYQVVVLIWEPARTILPEIKLDLPVRKMLPDDFQQVYKIDQQAFELIWRNSMDQLEAAYQEAFSATVIESDGKVVAYQISTTNSKGGHLARLVVDPGHQNRGYATRLLSRLLEDFQQRGIVEVTVNTQSNNKASLDLYQKFGFIQQKETYPVLQYQTRLGRGE